MACRLLHRLCFPTGREPGWIHLAAMLLLHSCPSLHPAQTLLSATNATTAQVRVGDVGLPHGMQVHCLPPGTLTDMAVALQRMGRLHAVEDGMPSVSSIICTPVAQQDLPHRDITRLAWLLPCHNRPNGPGRWLVPTSNQITVKALTYLVTLPSRLRRRQLHAAYITEAANGRPISLDHGNLAQTLAAIWRTPFANHLKTPLWRLAINCIRGGRIRSWRCPCDMSTTHQSSRIHSFWDCPVAHAVRNQLQQALDIHHLTRISVWLADPPISTMSLAVWRLVACLAIEAMDFGRRMLWFRHHNVRPCGDVGHVCNLAASRFWLHLHDFADAHHDKPPRFFTALASDHPFLFVRDGKLFVRLPGSTQGG